MTGGKKIFIAVIILAVIVGLFFGIRSYSRSKETPFDYVKKKGAKLSANPNGAKLNRYDYTKGWITYGFFSNNRVSQFDGDNVKETRRGTYDKEKIKWDNGTETPMSLIF